MQRQHSLLVIGQAIYGSIHLRFVRGRFAYYTLIVRNTKGIQSILMLGGLKLCALKLNLGEYSQEYPFFQNSALKT